jgi:hypothetical protein
MSNRGDVVDGLSIAPPALAATSAPHRCWQTPALSSTFRPPPPLRTIKPNPTLIGLRAGPYGIEFHGVGFSDIMRRAYLVATNGNEFYSLRHEIHSV